jgi:hypothetical protein
MGRPSFAGSLVAIAIVGIALAGCAPERQAPMPVPEPSTSSSASAKPVAAEVPKMLPGGTALANRGFFDYVNKKLFATNAKPGGKAIIDNLVASGFDKSAMQITPDKTSVLRLDADSIVFSVRIGTDCLIGQIGGHGYRSTVGPMLSDGVCLAGKTQSIG